MAYQTNFTPVEYLQRRVTYYKKKRGRIKGFLKNGDVLKSFSADDITEAINTITARISEYENAITILKSQQ